MKEYIQKNLGYPREKTDAKYRVTMNDGSIWEIPVQIIVDKRDEYYKDDEEDTIKFIRNKSLSVFEIEDWASNNMDWSEVKDYAKKVGHVQGEDMYQDGWTNGEIEVVGEI
jgi:hypothetical protein